MSSHLPAFAADGIRNALLEAGASGTIYSLVMPESESAMAFVVDGCERERVMPEDLAARRSEAWFSRYHEPWTQKQDAMHGEYFDLWFDWAAPVVAIDRETFAFRYPTAGASEAIFKLMSEYAAGARHAGRQPEIHVFEGEYEGFRAYAESLSLPVVAHSRCDWHEVPGRIAEHVQFWISQPSAIDGRVWTHFAAFAELLAERCPTVELIPDLTYVGSVAREFRVDLDLPNVASVVISHSKPFGGYYHRVGGALSRVERPSLFGNKWFKNLQSLAWGSEMMRRHAVHDLPRKYRAVQEQAARSVGERLGIALEPADVLLLGIAPPAGDLAPPVAAVLRGSAGERVVRLCLTPEMTCLIDPKMAPATMAHRQGAGDAA